MRNVSSAFWLKLQQDGLTICDLIDLELPFGGNLHWTTANGPVTYTLSGAPTVYVPFPGGAAGGLEESIDLGVSVIGFTMANTGDALQTQLLQRDFSLAGVKIGQVFTDTPDLGRMDTYIGKIGDFSHDRLEISGQARNIWKSLNIQWPYYTYQDKCVWRFGSAGCGFNVASITINVGTINVGSSTALDVLLNTGSLNGYTTGRFNYGRATCTHGTNSGAVRTIRNHTGDLLSLSHAFPNTDMTGFQMSIYPGCQKRLVEDCHSLYNNDGNALSFPWMPNFEDAF